MQIELPYAKELIKSREGDSSDLLLGMKAISFILKETDQSAEIDSHVNTVVELVGELDGSVNAIAKIFRDYEFREPNAEEFHEYGHSDLASAIVNKKGLRITYATLILEICRRLGNRSMGVNFPGMFLVQVGYTVVDPIGCKPVNYVMLRDQVRRMKYFVTDEPQKASNQEILSRVFQNLVAAAENKEDILAGLQFIDYLKLLSPTDWSPHFKEAQFRGSMGDLVGARTALGVTRNLLNDGQTLTMIDQFERDLELNATNSQVRH